MTEEDWYEEERFGRGMFFGAILVVFLLVINGIVRANIYSLLVAAGVAALAYHFRPARKPEKGRKAIRNKGDLVREGDSDDISEKSDDEFTPIPDSPIDDDWNEWDDSVDDDDRGDSIT